MVRTDWTSDTLDERLASKSARDAVAVAQAGERRYDAPPDGPPPSLSPGTHPEADTRKVMTRRLEEPTSHPLTEEASEALLPSIRLRNLRKAVLEVAGGGGPHHVGGACAIMCISMLDSFSCES